MRKLASVTKTKNIDKKTVSEEDRDILNYTDKSWAVIGNTKVVKDQLFELDGKYVSSHTIDNKRTVGWIFPKSTYNEQQMVNIKKLNVVKFDIYDLSDLENWTDFDYNLYLAINENFKNHEANTPENNKINALKSLSKSEQTTEFLSNIFISEDFKRAVKFDDSLIKALVKFNILFVPDRKRLYDEVIYTILSNKDNYDAGNKLSKDILNIIVKLEPRFQ
jgi:hypothetical protein